MADYMWALTHIANVFQQFGVRATGTFVTDRELALMNSLERVFPNAVRLLCRWQISKNIQAKQRRAFETNDSWEEFLRQWHFLGRQETVTSYEDQLKVMQREFANYPQVMRYIEEVWLVWKVQFVSAFLHNKPHFRNIATSRVESAHVAFKLWISTSTGNLFTVETAVKLACDNQLAGIVQKHVKKRAIVNMQLGPLFFQAMGKISEDCLRLTHRQCTQRYIDGNLDDNCVTCTNLLTSTMGHPCRHVLLNCTEPLTIDDFDQYWHLFQPAVLVEAANVPPNIDDALTSLRNQYSIADDHNKGVLLHHILHIPTVTVQDLVRVQAWGKPSGSTKWNLSHFEHLENAENAPTRRRCRNCNQVGHNSMTFANHSHTPLA